MIFTVLGCTGGTKEKGQEEAKGPGNLGGFKRLEGTNTQFVWPNFWTFYKNPKWNLGFL